MSSPRTEHDEPIDDFDAEKAVHDYRRVMAKLDRARKPETKARYKPAAKALRTPGPTAGQDSLYEMAFGEP